MFSVLSARRSAATARTLSASLLASRTVVWFRRTAPAWRLGGTVSMVIVFFFWLGMISDGIYFGFDTWAYWRVPHLGIDLYAGNGNAGGLGVFRYSPVFMQAISALWFLPWPLFLFVWISLLATTLFWLAGRWTPLALVFFLGLNELYFGNIHLLLAAAIVLGFRYPVTWSFLLLTKVTPGIGLLWFVVRREWGHLAWALGATVALIAVSLLTVGPGLWGDWLHTLLNTTPSTGGNHIELPLWLRLAAGAGLVVWGARSNRRWTVLVAAMFALPTLWFHGFSMLAGLFALGERQRLRPVWILLRARLAPERVPSRPPGLPRAPRHPDCGA